MIWIISINIILFGCGDSTKANTDSVPWDSAVLDSADSADTADMVVLEEVDADGDGYPAWNSTRNFEIADCDDADPTVTPWTERWIPKGYFYQGQNNAPFTSPQIEVYVSSYCIDIYEVTNQEFVAFMMEQKALGLNNQTRDGKPLFDFEDMDDIFPERILRNGQGFVSSIGYENHPVTEVWKWSADAFCGYYGKKLPTEAEWEKAARGPDKNTFPWGEEQPNCTIANFGTPTSQCVGDTMPVGSYPLGVSPYGVFDMAGNVSEFVSDWFQAEYYSQSPLIDPQGPETGYYNDGQGNEFVAIIAKSGNHATSAQELQSSFRTPEPETATSNGVGFRCARALE